MTDTEVNNEGAGVEAPEAPATPEFPTSIIHEFDGVACKCTVERDANNEYVVTVVPLPVKDAEGNVVQEPKTQPKKDETGSAVLNEDGTNVLEEVTDAEGNVVLQDKLDPLSGRFVKYPAEHVFEGVETWQE